MPNNPYAASAASLDVPARDVHLYTPDQIAAGAFFGGPLAALYFIHANFLQLNAAESARQTLIWGSLLMVALFGLIAVLPDSIPSVSYAAVYALSARQFALHAQLSKQAIFDSGYDFQSNGKVAGMTILCVVLTVIIGFSLFALLSATGLLH